MLARILRLLPTKTLDGYEHSELISEIYICQDARGLAHRQLAGGTNS